MTQPRTCAACGISADGWVTTVRDGELFHSSCLEREEADEESIFDKIAALESRVAALEAANGHVHRRIESVCRHATTEIKGGVLFCSVCKVCMEEDEPTSPSAPASDTPPVVAKSATGDGWTTLGELKPGDVFTRKIDGGVGVVHRMMNGYTAHAVDDNGDTSALYPAAAFLPVKKLHTFVDDADTIARLVAAISPTYVSKLSADELEQHRLTARVVLETLKARK